MTPAAAVGVSTATAATASSQTGGDPESKRKMHSRAMKPPSGHLVMLSLRWRRPPAVPDEHPHHAPRRAIKNTLRWLPAPANEERGSEQQQVKW